MHWQRHQLTTAGMHQHPLFTPAVHSKPRIAAGATCQGVVGTVARCSL